MTDSAHPGKPPRFSKAGAALLIALSGLLVASAVFAIKAEKPWGRTVQKRVEKGLALTPKEHAVIGLWWGAVVNTGLLALLVASGAGLLGSGTGLRPVCKAGIPPASVPGTTPGRHAGFNPVPLVLLLAALALAAWLRAPRLSHSLWNDEEYAMRKFAHGAWEQSEDGGWTFEPATWTTTLFENRNGNNHLLNSVITRFALDAWRACGGAPRGAFSEAALRTPAFVAGLLTIVMIYLLGCRMGGPPAGVGAAFILALCPWHVRYAVEARGYSFMLLFVCVAVDALLRALEGNRLRWWLVFAMSEAAFVLSFAGSAYVALALNAFAAFELVRMKQGARVWTLAAFNVLAALPVIEWMLPSVPQLLNYLRSEDSLHLSLGWPFLRDFFSGLAIGFQFDNPGAHAGTDWLSEARLHPWVVPAFGILGAMLAAGTVMSLFKGTAARLAISAPMLAVLLAYAQNLLSGSPMVVWYLVYVILPASLALPVAALGFRPRRGGPGWLNIALPVAIYAGAAFAPALRLRDQPRQPMREAVAFARSGDADAVTAVLGVSDRQIASYDAKARVIGDRGDLGACIDAARRANKPLFVFVCGHDAVVRGADAKLRGKQDLLAILDRKGDGPGFVPVADFPGTEEMFSYRVYRLDPPRE